MPLPNQFTSEQVLQIKLDVLELFENEQASSLSEAADMLGVPKLRMYRWYQSDPDWKSQVQQADLIKRDSLVRTLDEKAHILGLMFHIKKIDPTYRENFRVNVSSDALEKLLGELKKLGEEPKQEERASIEEV